MVRRTNPQDLATPTVYVMGGTEEGQTRALRQLTANGMRGVASHGAYGELDDLPSHMFIRYDLTALLKVGGVCWVTDADPPVCHPLFEIPERLGLFILFFDPDSDDLQCQHSPKPSPAPSGDLKVRLREPVEPEDSAPDLSEIVERERGGLISSPQTFSYALRRLMSLGQPSTKTGTGKKDNPSASTSTLDSAT